MLPPDATRTITIWPRWRNDTTDPRQFISMRRVLHNCSWKSDSISTVLRTGIVLQQPIIVRVFDETSGLQYIPPHIWNQMSPDKLDGYWTCDPIDRPLIAGFESAMTFASGTSAQVTTAENAYLRLTPGVANIIRADDNGGDRENGNLKFGAHIFMNAG